MQEETTRLNELLKHIEDARNYYAMFFPVLQMCVSARELNTRLFDNEKITDEQFRANCDRISKAENTAINSHMLWTLAWFVDVNAKKEYTKEQLIKSIYHDIFGTGSDK